MRDQPGGLQVRRAGRATFQDLGRPAAEQLGLSVNGAADQFAARAANRLVANPDEATLIETLAFPVECVARTQALVAVTGLDTEVTVDGLPRRPWEPLVVEAGQTLTFWPGGRGLRSFLAVHGGFDAPQFAGSAAPDTIAGFAQALAPGAELTFARAFAGFPRPGLEMPLFRLAPEHPAPPEVWRIKVVPVPGDGGIPAVHRQLDVELTVGALSNHVGLRLTGVEVRDIPAKRLLSRGVPVGAVEVPPSGEPIVLLRGRFVTAGYPVVGVVSTTSTSLLGQARPGQRLRFVWQSRAEAVAAARAERRELDLLAQRVRTAFTASGLHLPDRPPRPGSSPCPTADSPQSGTAAPDRL